jgi:hypothetical protein
VLLVTTILPHLLFERQSHVGKFAGFCKSGIAEHSGCLRYFSRAPLQLPLDCGQSLRRVDKGDGAQGERIRQKAAEEVIALPLALVLDGRGQAGRRARAVLRVLQQQEVLRFGQLHPEGQAVVRP